MSLKSQMTLRRDAEMKGRVISVLYKLATDVRNESDQTQDHYSRLKLAESFRSEDQTGYKADLFLPYIAANPTIDNAFAQGGSAAVPDGDLEFVVASFYNIIALQEFPDPEEEINP